MGSSLKLNKKPSESVSETCKDKEEVIAAKSDKSDKNKSKTKRDWKGLVHRGCRVCVFRTLEGIFAVLVVTIFTMLIGSMAIPTISYSMASSAGITQSTDLYTTIALWILPMLFFSLLITAASFCVLRIFLRWLHRYFSKFITR